MKSPNERLLFIYWLAIAAFIAGSACFFFFGRSSAQVKRKAFRWYIGIGGLLVLGWLWIGIGPQCLLVAIPAFAVSAYLALKTTQFCESCGKVLVNQYVRAKYCPRCGADLSTQERGVAKESRDS
jgi:predicted RNA-binding Zn-ribbon protein involved in translation (DUF1610 family)